MARKKVGEEPRPEKNEVVSLRRLEERNERVPISPEQAQERMRVAAGVISEARVLDREFADLSGDARTKKKAAEAKHEEADRIVMDAQSGTVLLPYPVIVERHPTHPTEMTVWRTPDGVVSLDLLEADMPEGMERIAAREAQGCILVD